MGEINSGDTAFVLMSAALVALMTPGLAFFYGGLVRRKNFLAIMMQSFISMGVVTFLWVAVGYSLAFSGEHPRGLHRESRLGVPQRRRRGAGAVGGQHPGSGALHLPGDVRHHHPGADHRRLRRPRELQELPLVPGRLEPAGLRALHALDLGRRVPRRMGRARLRRRHGRTRERRHGGPRLGVGRRTAGVRARASARCRTTSPSSRLGTGLLWFGWFGFNGGSALAANGIAAQAFVNTDIAGSIAMCTWLFISWKVDGKPSLIGAFTGAVAGLACVTPCAGYIPTWSAFVIGLLAGSVCYGAVKFKERMKWDDALDVWAAHGVGGILGSIAARRVREHGRQLRGRRWAAAGQPGLPRRAGPRRCSSSAPTRSSSPG